MPRIRGALHDDAPLLNVQCMQWLFLRELVGGMNDEPCKFADLEVSLVLVLMPKRTFCLMGWQTEGIHPN